MEESGGKGVIKREGAFASLIYKLYTASQFNCLRSFKPFILYTKGIFSTKNMLLHSRCGRHGKGPVKVALLTVQQSLNYSPEQDETLFKYSCE